MLAWLVERFLQKQEQRFGEPLGFLRMMYRLSRGAFFKFGLIGPLTQHRTAAPRDCYYVARLVSVRKGGCGECTRTVANLARREGVAEEIIQAALRMDPDALPTELRPVLRLTVSVLEDRPEVPAVRTEVERLFGQGALVDNAFAIITGQIFPLMKRTLGHSRPCVAADLRP
jgi:alkylhydroperoxidase family enzyme